MATFFLCSAVQPFTVIITTCVKGRFGEGFLFFVIDRHDSFFTKERNWRKVGFLSEILAHHKKRRRPMRKGSRPMKKSRHRMKKSQRPMR